MSNHLSKEQLAKCFVGQSTVEERQHLSVCGECSAQLDRFRESISTFSNALTDCAAARVALQPGFEIRPATVGDPRWRWALVAATALVLAVMPFVGIKTDIIPRQTLETPPQSHTDADALMRTVQLQLSRTIPAPMEPVIALLPTQEPTLTRGVQ
jgi:hypothetical protein